MMNLWKKFNEKIPKEKRLTIIVIIGLLGIAFVLIFDFSNEDTVILQSENIDFSDDTQEYKMNLEKELVKILQEVEGVGEVKVMLTIEGSKEYVYAESFYNDNKSQEGYLEESYRNEYIILDNKNQKEALIKKVIKPKINGVIVVCEGGDDLVVSEKVYKAVSTVLDITASRVCVVKG